MKISHPLNLDTAYAFADHLRKSEIRVRAVLQKYESADTVTAELMWTLSLLDDIRALAPYFTVHVHSVSTFLPLNLPLYSFALYALTPSFQASSVCVKVPVLLQPLWSELSSVLQIHDFFPHISFHTGDRRTFVSECRVSDVVVFTGTYENFTSLRKSCASNTLSIYNGVGHNPLVITDTAPLTLAVQKTLHTRLFNSGQDCAAPDAILVHASVAHAYLDKLMSGLDCVEVGDTYLSERTQVGPLLERGIIDRFAAVLSSATRAGAAVAYGGQVNFSSGVIEPCVCVSTIDQFVNFDELYSPVFMVSVYPDDASLAQYFQDTHGKYKEKQMYVSEFGHSDFLHEGGGSKSIVLKEKTILDTESSIEPFGGYGVAASGVAKGGVYTPGPVLIPREIYNAFSGAV